MESPWDTWVAFFRDTVQNLMLQEDEIKDSVVKECSTKVAIFSPQTGAVLAADPGFAQFKELDVMRLAKGVGGDQDVFSGLSWGTEEKPKGYSIIRLLQYPLKCDSYSNVAANILYGRNKTYPEESIFVSNSLTCCVVVLFRLKGANKGLIHSAMSHFAGAVANALDLGV